MKKILAALLMLPALAMGAANDLFINQRNALDTGTLSRTVTIPAGGANGIFGFNGSTVLPMFFTLGPSLTISGGVIDAVASAPSWSSITGKPSFAAVATTGAYSDLSGKPALFSGAYADLTGVPGTFTPAPHTHAAGDIVSGTFATARLPALAISQTTGLQAALDSKFPAPTGSTAQYLRGDGSVATFPTIPGGTVTSVTAGTGLSGGTITTSGTISMPSVGTAGSYANVTTDTQGRVTAGTNRSQAAATRSLNTIFQISATRDAQVQYAVQCTVTASIGGGQDGDVFLDIASDSAFTTNVQSVDVAPCSQTYTLAVAIQGVQKGPANVRGYVPAGYYARIRTVNNTGTPAFAYRLGQEVLQ